MNPTPNQPADALREAIAKVISAQHGCPPNALEPGDAYGIDGRMPNGDPAHFNWRRFVGHADAILTGLHASGLVEKDGDLEQLERYRQHLREKIYVDATPDDGLAVRILSAHIDESEFVSEPATTGILMNDWQRQRNALLRHAIATLAPAKVDETRADEAHLADLKAQGLPILDCTQVVRDPAPPDGAKETTETDAEEFTAETMELPCGDGPTKILQCVPASFARTLELQRNALRRELQEAKAFFKDGRVDWDALNSTMKRQNETSEANLKENIDLRTQLQAATQELEGLRADRERLDWLEKRATFIEVGHADISPDRASIDSAMSAQTQG